MTAASALQVCAKWALAKTMDCAPYAREVFGEAEVFSGGCECAMASTGSAHVSISPWQITNIEFARRLRAAGWVAEGSQLRDPSGHLLRDYQFVIVGPDGRETTMDDPLHKRLEVFLVQRHMVAFGE